MIYESNGFRDDRLPGQEIYLLAKTVLKQWQIPLPNTSLILFFQHHEIVVILYFLAASLTKCNVITKMFQAFQVSLIKMDFPNSSFITSFLCRN